jgi:hypothetical protein
MFVFSLSDGCAKVHCPPVDVSPCPVDSYRLPTMLDHRGAQDDDEGSHERRKCCPEPVTLEKCQCIPGLQCSVPECPTGTTLKLLQNATKEPGKCCAKFSKCIQSKQFYALLPTLLRRLVIMITFVAEGFSKVLLF